MTKEELMAMLRDPDQTGHSVDELNRLIEKNPYFHTGHQLYLKGLQQTNENEMALQLRKTALNVRDRGVLYNYINRPSTSRQETIPNDLLEEETAVPFVPGSSYVSQQADIHHTQYDTFRAFSTVQDTPSMDKEWHDSEAQIISEEKVMSNDQLMNVILQRLEQIDSSQTEEKNQSSSDAETNVDLYPDEFSKDTLVDSFLKSNPKLIPNESQFEVDLMTGMQENTEIATETLADIYATQGHKDKAIEIFQQLILKYPEKHIYFAAQIEKLKS